jgi:hypothetical protein
MVQTLPKVLHCPRLDNVVQYVNNKCRRRSSILGILGKRAGLMSARFVLRKYTEAGVRLEKDVCFVCYANLTVPIQDSAKTET